MRTYLKWSAALPLTKLFKTLLYDPSKGIKSFYTQLLQVSEKMITHPDQAMFDEHFINALPSHFKEELVMCDKISVDFLSKGELWTVVLCLDHTYDSLKAINAYQNTSQPKVGHPSTNLMNKSPNHSSQSNHVNKMNNSHYSKNNCSNDHKQYKPFLQNNKLPGTQRPTALAAGSLNRKEERGTSVTKPPFWSPASTNLLNHLSLDKAGNPICYCCGKIGYTNECPNHPQRTRVFLMGLNGEEETPVEAQLDMHNTPDGVLDPDIKNKENTDKIQFVDNPYEEDMYGEENNEDPELGQFPTICFVDIDDEIDGKTYFGSMTFIDPNDDNYAIKLASAQRADKLLSQEEIVTELVNDPVLKFKAEGQLMKKAGLKPKVSGAKPAPKTPPVFDAKFRIS